MAMDNYGVAVNYEISFNAYNKKRFDNFLMPSSLPKESLTRIINSLVEDLESYKPDTSGEYYEYYKKYNFIPLSGYENSVRAAKEGRMKNFEKVKSIIARGGLKKEELTGVDHYYFLKSCNETFNREWPISPSLYFSNQLIDSVLKDSHELLYNQYLYDNAPTNEYHLPIISILDGGDESAIRPHHVDFKHAAKLLKELSKHKTNEDVLRQEIELFKKLLNKVITGDIILALNNHSM